MGIAPSRTPARGRVRFPGGLALLTLATLATLAVLAGAAGGAPGTFAHLPLTVAAAPAGPVQVSAVVDGAVGGRIAAGRFAVVVPSGAFAGVGTISLTVPNPSVLQCTLDISPVSLDQFAPPVQLSCDASGVDSPSPFALTMAYLDPMRREWTPVEASVESPDLIVTAPLRHFCTYSVQSKAGW